MPECCWMDRYRGGYWSCFTTWSCVGSFASSCKGWCSADSCAGELSLDFGTEVSEVGLEPKTCDEKWETSPTSPADILGKQESRTAAAQRQGGVFFEGVVNLPQLSAEAQIGEVSSSRSACFVTPSARVNRARITSAWCTQIAVGESKVNQKLT